MLHQMNLWNDSFESIKSGSKTIEMRLNDEKRRLINVGDIIEFRNTSTSETISCLVKNIYRYKTFEELYSHHDKVSIGYRVNETANPDDMLTYYTKEDINKYGVLAIELEPNKNQSNSK